MSIPGKVLIALLCAALVAAAGVYLGTDSFSFMQAFLLSAASAVLAVILSHRALPMPAAISSEPAPAEKPAQVAKKKSNADKSRTKKPAKQAPAPAPKPKGDLETGTVKWFNGSKGFGFIIRESGEEIFVHHRSIVGEGRRNLRDGASVRFRVAETDKGPQAEDVEPVESA